MFWGWEKGPRMWQAHMAGSHDGEITERDTEASVARTA